MESCKRARRPLPPALLPLLAFLALAATPTVCSAEPSLGALEPSEAALRVAGLREPLDAGEFLEAALRFSGSQGPGLAAARSKARELIEAASGLQARAPRARAESLLEMLHRAVFRQYDERQTRLDELLTTGRFNCVSSAVLYGLLARSLGLEFQAVQTPDHAFILVRTGAQGWDVETTNPYGFDPGSRKEFTDSFGRVTGYSYVPPGQYGRRKELGDKGLLSLILYNRNAYATDAGHYLEALQPAADAHALRQDPESSERLVLSCLNVAAYYGQAGRYDEGVRFLDGAARRSGDPRLARVREDLLHNWAVSLIEARRLQEAQGLIDDRRSRGELSETEWRSLGVTIWQLLAKEAARRDFAEAAALLRRALEQLGPEASLAAGYEVYVHNQAAGLVNAGRLDDALGVLREALRVLPSSSRLREDEALLARRSP